MSSSFPSSFGQDGYLILRDKVPRDAIQGVVAEIE
jgi:hypothetical protein